MKLLWDEDTRNGSELHVILMGSSPLLVHKGLSESLAGRFEMLRVPHGASGKCGTLSAGTSNSTSCTAAIPARRH